MNLNRAATSAVPLVALLAIAILAPGVAGASSVNLGTASDFAVLAGAGITNTGTTTIVGDVGSHPTAAQSGFDTVLLTGTNHGNDAVTAGAKDDLQTAYVDARDRTGGTPVGALAGLTLAPGVYTDDNAPDSMSLTGTLTLDGGGDPGSVFIFQSGSTLLLAANSQVLLVDGAQACNVFWQVTSSATLQTGAHLEGTILALASITLGTGATINGAALASTGSVTMSGNTIAIDPCDAPTGSPSPTATASPSPTATSSETQTTSPSPTQSETQTTSPSPTRSETQTTSPSPTQSETQTTSPSLTQSETLTKSPSPTQSTSPTPTTSIPVFPTKTAMLLASAGAVGGALLLLRRRL